MYKCVMTIGHQSSVKEMMVNPGRKDPHAGHNFDEIKKRSRRLKFEFGTSCG